MTRSLRNWAALSWQVSPDDSDALTETLRAALSDVARLRKMGAESYRIVAEEVNLEKMVEIFIEATNRVKPNNPDIVLPRKT